MIHLIYAYFLRIKPKKERSKTALWIHWQIYKYLKMSLPKFYKNLSHKYLGVDENSNIIVSLTSFPARIDVVHLAIKSILSQTKRPIKVVLWLANEQFPDKEENLPKTLLDLKTCGLEIEFCKDLKAHKKYFFSFQKYPNNLVVTVDDDVIYPKNLLEVLYNTHLKYPQSVVANRVRLMEFENTAFKPYRGWKINDVDDLNSSNKIFSTGVGGVLYQPNLFQKSLFDTSGIHNTQCMNDDIWLKAGEIVSSIPVVFTKHFFKHYIEIPNSQKESLFSKNVFESDNDRQISDVFSYFNISEDSFTDDY